MSEERERGMTEPMTEAQILALRTVVAMRSSKSVRGGWLLDVKDTARLLATLDQARRERDALRNDLADARTLLASPECFGNGPEWREQVRKFLDTAHSPSHEFLAIIEERTRERDRAIEERDEAYSALDSVSGALMDAATVPVPDDEMKYGDAVRELTKERDEARGALRNFVDRLETDGAITDYDDEDLIEIARKALLPSEGRGGWIPVPGGIEKLKITTPAPEGFEKCVETVLMKIRALKGKR